MTHHASGLSADDDALGRIDLPMLLLLHPFAVRQHSPPDPGAVDIGHCVSSHHAFSYHRADITIFQICTVRE
jgi:hypothetical protein